jgi:hypothetical protein
MLSGGKDFLGMAAVRPDVTTTRQVSYCLRHARHACASGITVIEGTLLLLTLPLPPPLSVQVLVGPGSPRAAHPISPPEVADFVNTAPAGVILMATGTTPQPRLALTQKDFLELTAGFAALAPTRVLWPLKQRALPDGLRIEQLPLGDNTLVVPWVDYNVRECESV